MKLPLKNMRQGQQLSLNEEKMNTDTDPSTATMGKKNLDRINRINRILLILIGGCAKNQNLSPRRKDAKVFNIIKYFLCVPSDFARKYIFTDSSKLIKILFILSIL